MIKLEDNPLRDKANEMIQNLKQQNSQLRNSSKDQLEEKFKRLMDINDTPNVHILMDYLDSVKAQQSQRHKSVPITPGKTTPQIVKKVTMFSAEMDGIVS